MNRFIFPPRLLLILMTLILGQISSFGQYYPPAVSVGGIPSFTLNGGGGSYSGGYTLQYSYDDPVETGKLEYYLRLQTQQASSQEQHPQNPVPGDQISVGFIDAEITHPDPLKPMRLYGYVNNFSPPAIISIRPATGSDKSHYTMSHEVGHIVTMEGHPAGAPQERLMVDGRNSRYAHDHKDSKRFILQEENWIRTRKHFYAPSP